MPKGSISQKRRQATFTRQKLKQELVSRRLKTNLKNNPPATMSKRRKGRKKG